ncbi:MAG TPA: ABC transporter permease [Hanamia sp.]|nr:ABC transporter permease [Hanamia sp.]
MFKNYFKTAWRNLIRNKIFSLINITGLTIGLTCCLLIALYIQHESGFDKFEKNGDRIARVIMQYRFNGSNESNEGNYTSVRVAAIFPKTFPEVESAIKMTEFNRVVLYDDKMFDEKNFMYADSNFFDIFSFKLLRGNIHNALAAPYNVILTESAAKKYFGNVNPINKTLRVGNDSNLYRVTGVMKDCPSNSQIQFDFLASFSSLGITQDYESSYWDANYTTYLLLKNKNAINQLQAKLPAFMKKEMEGQGASISFHLEPFRRIHLYSPYDSFVPNNSIIYIYILAAVALLILIIACSTYINLSTARSLERAKEVGIRKVVGAVKQQLFWQFISESVLLCLMAAILSMVVSGLLLPAFNALTNKNLQLNDLFSLPFILFSVAVALAISFFAGIYPALILTAFQPVKVLKGLFKNTSSGQGLRKSLIVFQFAISIFLIIATFIIQQQLHFIQHKKLGYDREHVLVLPMDSKMLGKLEVIKDEFKTNGDVLNVSRCVRSPVEGGGGYNMRSSVMPENAQIAVTANPVDEDFVNTVGLQVIAGTNFNIQDIKDAAPDSGAVYHFILNESATRQLGWTPQQAIGKKMFLGDNRPGYVRGVIKDFNFQSLHSPIKPFILFPEIRGKELLVKISGEHLAQTISFLESKWKALVPDRPFEYHFLDEDYDKLYQSEIRLAEIMKVFTSIGILLACFGLFGLSSYSIQQRTKEIGIRKVLGASVSNITALLAIDFIMLTAVSCVVAFPIAWWAAHTWLQDYSYRINISWWIFFAAGLIAIFIAMITVSMQAIKAAISNPVKSLRTE